MCSLSRYTAVNMLSRCGYSRTHCIEHGSRVRFIHVLLLRQPLLQQKYCCYRCGGLLLLKGWTRERINMIISAKASHNVHVDVDSLSLLSTRLYTHK